ncbi:MAG: RpiB/LacA/LacB family sugar-phosphate isomerase, partial [Bacteroidales bacterium]|nr:RpiB/LacA/LacB family sugar-phosphate isomerase [Bacteroidales bacterium]
MNLIKIALSSDHAGYKTKLAIIKYLKSEGYEVFDFGTHSEDSVDYPDYAHPLAESIENKKYDLGIALCGSGNGINMTLNKHKAIRSALCWNPEIAKLARLHNNAN